MKFKHNKKRNTAFLFEALVRELTKTVVIENREKKAEAKKTEAPKATAPKAEAKKEATPKKKEEKPSEKKQSGRINILGNKDD